MDFAESYRTLLERVVDGPGIATKQLRQCVCDYAQSLCVNREGDNPLEGTLGKWVEKVARFAYKTLPDEIETMKQEGKSEDEIFELTIAAALGAASGRYERAIESIEKGYAQ